MISKTTKLVFALLLPTSQAIMAQEEQKPSLTDGIEYGVEMQNTSSFGDGTTPLWLNANKYGLSSLDKNNGYLRATLQRPIAVDNGHKWGIGYGLDMAAAYNFTSSVIVQQAYVEGRWLKGVLTVGSKQQPMELKNQELSSGSQTFGINARPIPQVRLALPEYWDIPGTKGWLSIKGHIAYGMLTDEGWQKDFTQGKYKRTENTLYHSKAGYLKIGNGQKPLSLEMGLEMAALFGGQTVFGDGRVVKHESGLGAFWDALVAGGMDTGESEELYHNVNGDHLGSWVIRLNLDYDKWGASIYWDHFFEDHSSMFFLDYDGYGNGDEWNVKKDNRYLLYDLKDMLLGAELRLKDNKWLNNIVFEYLYTKYQSGPIYHDRTQNIPDHIGGADRYYNHGLFAGWQHWGQVMGNPLYLSPIYNNNGQIEVSDNRFIAFHIGLSGDPCRNLHYRLLASSIKGFGTFAAPFDDPRKDFSMLAEARYSFDAASPLKGWSIAAAFGLDAGKRMGNNQGLQFTIAKTWK